MPEPPLHPLNHVPDWAAPLAGGFVPLDWVNDGDEWVHHLLRAIAEQVSTTQQGYTYRGPLEELPFPDHYEFHVNSTTLTSSLRMIPLSEGVYVFVTGDGEPDSMQIEPWGMALRLAEERLGRSEETYEWYAIIGPALDIDRPAALAEPGTVGPLRLEPTGTHYLEFIATGMPSLFGRQGFGWWPVVVRGSAAGYDWFTAGGSAARDIRRLCGILSVAWRRGWTLRQAPQHPPLEEVVLAPGGPEANEGAIIPTEPDVWGAKLASCLQIADFLGARPSFGTPQGLCLVRLGSASAARLQRPNSGVER